MTAEAKMRSLAMQDATLAPLFTGTNGTFRWFDRQLQPGYINQGTCVRVLRISTVRLHVHPTQSETHSVDQQQPRFQIDVLDFDPERARSAASAIEDWLSERADFSSDAQFASPVTSPLKHPNFVLNQRAGMEPQTQPPVYVETLDVRIFDFQPGSN